jgi:hydroxymethylglutaryl-CoA lyase
MIHITECPRDAMQGIQTFIPSSEKVRYLQQLLAVGFPILDAGSFVSAKAIPQLADTSEVFDQLDLGATTTKILAIVANKRGAEDAANHEKVHFLGFPFSVSETFQQRNTHASIAESLDRVDEILEICSKQNKELLVYLSMAFGNPYGDDWSADLVAHWATTLEMRGVKHLSLADTTGVSNTESISNLFQTILPTLKSATLSAHLHTLSGDVGKKADAAYKAGCFRFDTALKGFGGCPMASDSLTGNMATEELIAWANNHAIETGLNMDALLEAEQIANKLFNQYQ